VVVIEDLISTGGSSLVAVNALREAGCEVKGLVAIFTYGFDLAIRNFADAECPFLTLTDYDLLIEQALKENYISAADVESLKEWKKDPSSWNSN
jgi:orotate phosphoribosyltransferase